MKEALLKIRADMEEIAGNWDGKGGGMAEDKAGSAKEAMELIDALIEILEGDYLEYL